METRSLKTALTSFAVMSAVLAVGLPSTAAASPKPVKIAVFLDGAANTYNEAELAGVGAAAKKLGATVKMFDGQFTTSTQVAQLQDALVSGQYQAFAIDANDGSAVVPYIKQAIRKGIKVAGMLSPIGPSPTSIKNQVPGMVTTVSFPEAGSIGNGAYLGDAVVQACATLNPCKVAYLPGMPQLPLEAVRTNGFNAVVKAHKNIQVVAEQAGEYVAGTSRTVVQNVLQAHPDLNVIASAGDQMTYGAEQAVNAAGLKGKVALIGNGASALGVAAVRAGRWFATVVNLPYTEGYIAGTALIRAARGEKTGYPTWVNEVHYSRVGPIVTHKNVGKFSAQWKG